MARVALSYEDFITEGIREKIPKWKAAGYNDKWVAAQIGISIMTFYKWKKERPEFERLFVRGKVEFLKKLESATLKLAMGHFVQEKEYAVDGSGNVVEDIIKIKEKWKQEPGLLRMYLAKVDPEWNKKSIEGEDTSVEAEERVVFGGSAEL